MRRQFLAAGSVVVLLAYGTTGGGVRLGLRDAGGVQVKMGTIKESPAERKKRLRREFDKEVAAARSDMEKKNWVEARSHLNVAECLMTDKSQEDILRPMYEKLEEEGRKLLNAATALFKAEKFLEALKGYQRISMTFGQLPCAREARTALAQAESHPAVQAFFLEAKAEVLDERIAQILDGQVSENPAGTSRPAKEAKRGRAERIRGLKDADRQMEAVDLLTTLVESYPTTDAGKRAERDLQELLSDESFRSTVDKHRLAGKAAAALKRAKVYQDSKMLDKAIQYYQEVIREYPDTAEAAEAAERIRQINPKASG